MLKIGIIAQEQPEDKFGINKTYLRFVYKFGIPVIILPIDANEDFSSIYKLDALVLPGGADVNSERYAKFPQLYTNNANIYLEHFDKYFLPKLIGNIPIFGICRGLQTLNVHFGGTLKNIWYHPYSNYDEDLAHEVFVVERKSPKMKVNSFHHQAIDKLANGFKVEAKTNNGIIEAISMPEKKIFAVQWHPERFDDYYSYDKFEEILK